MNNKRLKYATCFMLLLMIEIVIALYVRDAFIRPYVGDALVVGVLYCFARIFVPEGFKLLPLYIFLFALAVETLQYFPLLEMLGIQDNAFLRIVLGSVFDVKDIICYGVGCIIIVVAEKWISVKNARNI